MSRVKSAGCLPIVSGLTRVATAPFQRLRRPSVQSLRAHGLLAMVGVAAWTLVNLPVAASCAILPQDDAPPTQDATEPPVPIQPVQQPSKPDGPRNKDLYQVPDSDRADDLVRYLRLVLDFKPVTLAEYRLHVERGPSAIQSAADRLVAMETDPARLAFRIGRFSSIRAKLIRTPFVDAAQQESVVNEILRVHQTFVEQPEVYEEVKRELYDLAKRVARAIEQSGNNELAIQANRKLGELFADDVDRRLAISGRRMLGAANRLDSIGEPITIGGTLLDGTEFDWNAYRGRIVLVFFMSTVVGPVDAEMPQLQRLYRDYAEEGFAIVLVGLDEKQAVIEDYMEKNSIIWPCLFAAGTAWENPLAVEFGVDELPMGLLIDPDGRLISDRARTTELQRLLQEAYGH